MNCFGFEHEELKVLKNAIYIEVKILAFYKQVFFQTFHEWMEEVCALKVSYL